MKNNDGVKFHLRSTKVIRGRIPNFHLRSKIHEKRTIFDLYGHKATYIKTTVLTKKMISRSLGAIGGKKGHILIFRTVIITRGFDSNNCFFFLILGNIFIKYA